MVARKEALNERLSRLATDERLWPTVARLRAFRGVGTLTALTLHLELGGDWERFSSPRKLFSWLGLTPSLEQSGESRAQGDHEDRLALRAAASGRVGLTLLASSGDRSYDQKPLSRPARSRAGGRMASPASTAWASQSAQGTRQARQRRHGGGRANSRASLGGGDGAMS